MGYNVKRIQFMFVNRIPPPIKRNLLKLRAQYCVNSIYFISVD